MPRWCADSIRLQTMLTESSLALEWMLPRHSADLGQPCSEMVVPGTTERPDSFNFFEHSLSVPNSCVLMVYRHSARRCGVNTQKICERKTGALECQVVDVEVVVVALK